LTFETFLNVFMDTHRHKASCSPRPRLPCSVHCRPPSSMFDRGSVFTIVFQALFHLLFMSWGVRYAKSLEESTNLVRDSKVSIHSQHHFGERLGKLVNVLSKKPVQFSKDEDSKAASIFRRAPFRPNYETNLVFMFGIVQSTTSLLVNHQGMPFYQSILESRDLCKAFCIATTFFLICVTGMMPRITAFMDIKPFPSWHCKFVVMGLAVANVLACLLGRWIAVRFIATTKGGICETVLKHVNNRYTAADQEENLLREEAKLNARGLKIFFGLLVYFIFGEFIPIGLKAPRRGSKVVSNTIL